MKRLLSIAGLALLGIALAVGVTMAAASLSSQSVGISEESLEAGEDLAVPAATTPPRPRARTATTPATTTARTTPRATAGTTHAPPPTAVDDDPGEDRSGSGGDHSGGDDSGGDDSGSDDSGRGRGRGRGGDDD